MMYVARKGAPLANNPLVIFGSPLDSRETLPFCDPLSPPSDLFWHSYFAQKEFYKGSTVNRFNILQYVTIRDTHPRAKGFPRVAPVRPSPLRSLIAPFPCPVPPPILIACASEWRLIGCSRRSWRRWPPRLQRPFGRPSVPTVRALSDGGPFLIFFLTLMAHNLTCFLHTCSTVNQLVSM
jgi:hypothetical protein